MEDRIIKVEVPTKETIERLATFGIDVEAEMVRAFRDELHMILHPEEKEKSDCN